MRRAAVLAALVAAGLAQAAPGAPVTAAPTADSRPATARSAPAPAASADPNALNGDTPLSFTVLPGDTLIGLSRQVFVSAAAWKEIAALNRLADADRIRPGQVLMVPARLMRSTPRAARVEAAHGEVRRQGPGGEAPLRAGDLLAEGERVGTGSAGSVVLRLADGSRVRLGPAADVALARSRSVGGRQAAEALAADPAAPITEPARDGFFIGGLRLISGVLEVLASPLRRARPLEVETPTAVIGVRGTEYRVGLTGPEEASATVAAGTARAEVLGGTVRVDRMAAAAAAPAGADVGGGFGATVSATDTAPRVRALPAAPDLSGLPALFERPVIRVRGLSASDPLRVQVAADEGFERIVAEQRVPAGGEWRVAGLEDGRWWVRARRVDTGGLEGYDARRDLVLKARPEPPATLAPRPGERLTPGPVDLRWTAHPQAIAYRLQTARDEAFTQGVTDQGEVTQPQARLTLEQPGRVFWRLRTVRQGADGAPDAGPWGDPQTFELRALPGPARVSRGDGELLIAWGAQEGVRYRVELARDAAFTDVVGREDRPVPTWRIASPGPGTWYFRLAHVYEDGELSPPGPALAIEVPRDWRYWWGLLLPVLAVF
jgi:hypothetical protein